MSCSSGVIICFFLFPWLSDSLGLKCGLSFDFYGVNGLSIGVLCGCDRVGYPTIGWLLTQTGDFIVYITLW